jgi:hypothetical protein
MTGRQALFEIQPIQELNQLSLLNASVTASYHSGGSAIMTGVGCKWHYVGSLIAYVSGGPHAKSWRQG